MRVLLTGFEPFGKQTVNPSWEAVKAVSERPGKNILVKKFCLPVEYDRCFTDLAGIMETLCPDAVICLGVAGRREAVTPEYVAVNIKDSPMADNAGRICVFEPIVEEGESALYTGLPLPEVLDVLHAAGVPAAPSFDAGTYVCNNLFYRLMDHIRHGHKKRIGGFIHVPPAEAVSPRDVAHGMEAVLRMLADRQNSPAADGGIPHPASDRK